MESGYKEPPITTVGLPEASVKESKERVKSAIGNSGYRFPDDRITVNLAPAAIKKEGTGFDLPIAGYWRPPASSPRRSFLNISSSVNSHWTAA